MQNLGTVMERHKSVKRSNIAAMKGRINGMLVCGDQRIQVLHMVQKRPYTYIKLGLKVGRSAMVYGTGFAKAQSPDLWSDVRGIVIATNYAVNDLVDALLHNGVLDRKTLELVIS